MKNHRQERSKCLAKKQAWGKEIKLWKGLVTYKQRAGQYLGADVLCVLNQDSLINTVHPVFFLISISSYFLEWGTDSLSLYVCVYGCMTAGAWLLAIGPGIRTLGPVCGVCGWRDQSTCTLCVYEEHDCQTGSSWDAQREVKGAWEPVIGVAVNLCWLAGRLMWSAGGSTARQAEWLGMTTTVGRQDILAHMIWTLPCYTCIFVSH